MGPRLQAPAELTWWRKGVAASTVVLPGQPGRWVTAADHLIDRFRHVSAPEWRARFERGDVLHADGQVLSLHDAFTPGARIHYFRDVADEAPLPFQETVLHQDEHLLVADKPHFLPVVPSGHHLRETLLLRLRNRLGLPHLTPVHRIDRDTAGLVMFSVSPVTRNVYHALFRHRAVHKTYEAITRWNPALPWVQEGSTLTLRRSSRIVPSTAHFMQMMEAIDAPESAANAETLIRVLRLDRGLAHLELKPFTGQRHQLRVHLNALGMPIVHDGIYPVLKPEGANDFTQPLQLLARSLSFADPVSGQTRSFGSAFSLSIG